MGFHSFAPLAVLITALFLLQVHCSPAAFQKRGICATEDPDASFLSALQQVRGDESQADEAGTEARTGPIEIETWFHIISSRAERNQVTDSMINSQVRECPPSPIRSCEGSNRLPLPDSYIRNIEQHFVSNSSNQISILQDAYADASIHYHLVGVTRHVNDNWARNVDDVAMKTALRKGTYRTLNVYFQTDLQATPDQAGRNGPRDLVSSVLGFCTLPDPTVNASSPASVYVKDGCNVLAQTMPGGVLDLYNRGGTAIHEIGHWNGLLHTFQGESCAADNPGDYIADTPQQSTPTDGCPARKDSCPGLPGVDAVHDFMDYSSDVCYESFTPGQNARMRNMWASMREGK
ncbi:hypothetical protein N7462_002749 [Penicillium macrosclerotiorum]|uniref:uncharacterized protein n=1 Tax=Penicillium macrosclerotiorum TaxID=303699 RepID=UPI002547782F|nr:uncharacterized protein N7462_002749 [Penicillium macrosclerotiorum]KAJ5693326.1 hypothetical protein N7462_002749 [Penicillium macrosclerotiorum]